MESADHLALALEFPAASFHEDYDDNTRSTMDQDCMSEHGSLADSSYDIVSDYETNDDLATTSSLASHSPVPTRSHTPTTSSVGGDVSDDYQDLGASSVTPQIADATPTASLKLPKTDHVVVHSGGLAPALDLDRPFRIQYHGCSEYQEMILEKIAQAISVSNTKQDEGKARSRYNVVPLSSFGDEAGAPQVTLVPSSGVELVVDVCETCQSRQDGLIASESTTTAASSPQKPVSSCAIGSRPDLAVYLHTHDEQVSPILAGLANSSLHRGIPTLNIADSTLTSPPLVLTDRDLHMTANGARCPIEVLRFLDLKPLDLNRHIAFLLSFATSSTKDEQHGRSRTPASPVNFLQEALKRINLKQYIGVRTARAMVVASLIILAIRVAWNGIDMYLSSNHVASESDTAMTTAMASSQTWGAELSDWVATNVPSLNTVPRSATITAVVENIHQIEDPPVDLLHVKDWLYYIKMPNELANSKRLPQLQVSASTGGQPIEVSLAKWNATVYSLELHPSPGNEAVDVFVGFAKSSRIYTYKLQPRSTWKAMKRVQDWVDQRAIESRIAVCVASSKALSQMASKEVALFRDQANGLVVSSAEWLWTNIDAARRSSGTTAVDVWHKFELQTVAATQTIQDSRRELSRSISKRVTALSSSVNKRAEAIASAGSSAGETFGKSMDETLMRFEEGVQVLRQRAYDLSYSAVRPSKHLSTAQARAKSLIEDMKRRVLRARGGKHQRRHATEMDDSAIHRSKSCEKMGRKRCKHSHV